MKKLQKTFSGSLLPLVFLIIYPFEPIAAVDYSFSVEVRDPIEIGSLDVLSYLSCVITNTGDLGDTLDVMMEYEVPDTSWSVLLCVGPVCYPPWITQAPLELVPQASDSATVDMTPLNTHGGATASLTIQSRGDPTLIETVRFALITDGTDVLIIDGDGGSPYEGFYKDAVPGSLTKGVWELLLEPVTSEELGIFDYVVWLTGERFPALTTDEMNTLADYLDGGGKLFISGQDIGRDIGGTSFYSDYLHAMYVSDSSGIFALDGIDGEPISDGLSLEITGGDGANNQVSPSEVAALSNGAYAHPTFYYESTQHTAAVSSVWFHSSGPDSSHSSRVTYFAFGFEGINTQQDRSTVMRRVIEWLESNTVGIDCGCDEPMADPPRLPGAFVLHPNYPNPFNPTTTIAFEIADRTRVNLAIYDLRGRHVRTLVDRDLPGGNHLVVWNGKDEKGETVGNGSYFYRLVADGKIETRRMVVVK
jgi:hypothetical protein